MRKVAPLSEQDEQIRDAIKAGTSTGMVGDFVVVAEIIEPDGRATLTRLVPDGAMTHRTVGMLRSVLAYCEVEDLDGWVGE